MEMIDRVDEEGRQRDGESESARANQNKTSKEGDGIPRRYCIRFIDSYAVGRQARNARSRIASQAFPAPVPVFSLSWGSNVARLS